MYSNRKGDHWNCVVVVVVQINNSENHKEKRTWRTVEHFMDVQKKTTKLMLIRNYFSDTVQQVTLRVGNIHMLTTVSSKTIYSFSHTNIPNIPGPVGLWSLMEPCTVGLGNMAERFIMKLLYMICKIKFKITVIHCSALHSYFKTSISSFFYVSFEEQLYY